MTKLNLILVSDIKEDQYINLNFGVMDFARDLKQVMRGVCTAPRDVQSVWVYREQDNYAMGYIAYGNIQDKTDAEDQYVVFSPNITNGKYKWADRVFAASARDRSKAVKNAKKYLRPLTVTQVIDQTQDDLVDKAYDVQSGALKTALAATTPIGVGLFDANAYRAPRPNALQKELWHMLQSGYQFLDKELEQNLRAAFTALEDFSDSKTLQSSNYIFVEATQLHGQTVFRGFDDIPNRRERSMLTLALGDAFTYQQHELPEHIAEKLAVLSMIDVGQYVVGVGYRSAANIFYILRGK